MGRIIAAALALTVVTGCAGGARIDSDTRAADREALAVCVGFYEITDDIKAGIIADRDATPRLIAVHDQARYIDNELIRGGLAGLIAARNKGDSQRPFAGLVDRECMRLTRKYAD